MPDLTTLLSKFLSVLYGGFGGTNYLPDGVISIQTTPVSNVSTSETDLMSFALGAAALGANGKGVRITAWGTNGGNTNMKTVKVYFGATVVATLASSAANGNAWYAQATVFRKSGTTQEAIGIVEQSNLTPAPTHSTPGETLAGAVTIKTTGQSDTASNDVTQTGMLVEALP